MKAAKRMRITRSFIDESAIIRLAGRVNLLPMLRLTGTYLLFCAERDDENFQACIGYRDRIAAVCTKGRL